MIAKGLFAAAALLAAVPALAQQPRPVSPYTPLQDKPSCTRAQLKAATDAYVAGQKAGSLAGLPLHEKAQYLENMVDVQKGAGLWSTKLPVAHAMSFHDDKRCKTFTEVVVTEGGHPYVIGTRLYMHEGKVIRVDSLVTDKGDWLFNANAYLKYNMLEDWTPLAPAQRTAPAVMIEGAHAYFDAFADKFTTIPWGTPCARLEGGAYTDRERKPDASCNVGIPAGVLYINNRDLLIDEEMGVINVFCRFGNSVSATPDSHVFRYIGGKIRLVHTISVVAGPQVDDDGAVIRN